ncbi:uncharacterized protein LOC133180389 [Saccostrea echinata]|uniref:uncharacterized protein LOC133180389 n=1 Tax=Saccostrea echinata TaxID=191078 RepID=UPI002A7ECFA3|nr:uncharacterized protein LOC133180389 [Saccostrea echinata]
MEWGAAKAVDGKYSNRSVSGNQCTMSANGQRTAEWRVDLGEVVSISYIKIYYRTDNRPGYFIGRFAGFFLYVSNTTSKENGMLCFHEMQNMTGTPVEDQRINCSVYGRYVIYYNERSPSIVYPNYYSPDAYSELCEVEVYALRRPTWQMHNWPTEPIIWGAARAVDGQYFDRSAGGNQCTISDGKETAEWRVDLGSVVSISQISIYYRTGNAPKCDSGKYGLHCNRICGHCLDGSRCLHTNGSCLTGCSPGYKGPNCIRGMFCWLQGNPL